MASFLQSHWLLARQAQLCQNTQGVGGLQLQGLYSCPPRPTCLCLSFCTPCQWASPTAHLHIHYQSRIIAEYQCLTPVILATQEADIRRIEVLSQPGEIVHETLSWKDPTQKSGVAQGISPEFKPQHPPHTHTHKAELYNKEPRFCSQTESYLWCDLSWYPQCS
jgi:hypothetical protein